MENSRKSDQSPRSPGLQNRFRLFLLRQRTRHYLLSLDAAQLQDLGFSPARIRRYPDLRCWHVG